MGGICCLLVPRSAKIELHMEIATDDVMLTVEDIMSICQVSRRMAYRIAHEVPEMIRVGRRKGIRVPRHHFYAYLYGRKSMNRE